MDTNSDFWRSSSCRRVFAIFKSLASFSTFSRVSTSLMTLLIRKTPRVITIANNIPLIIASDLPTERSARMSKKTQRTKIKSCVAIILMLNNWCLITANVTIAIQMIVAEGPIQISEKTEKIGAMMFVTAATVRTLYVPKMIKSV